MLFNVKSHCEICPEVEKEYKAISASYKDERSMQKEGQTPVFFAIIYYEQSTQLIFNRVSNVITVVVFNKISSYHHGKQKQN